MEKLIQEFNDKLAVLNKQINDSREQLSKTINDEMFKSFKPYFEKYPNLDSIFWRQFTPFFNDGEPLVFNVHEINVLFRDDEDPCDYEGSSFTDRNMYLKYKSYIEEWEAYEENKENWINSYVARTYDNGQLPKWAKSENITPAYMSKKDLQEQVNNYEENKEFYDDVSQMKEAISSIDKETMKYLYGDHVQVTINIDGINTEDYDHD